MGIPTPKKKTEFDIDYCPGVAEEPSLTEAVRKATVHPTCFNATIRKLPEYSAGCHDKTFSSCVLHLV
jgi:hypothetical protein